MGTTYPEGYAGAVSNLEAERDEGRRIASVLRDHCLYAIGAGNAHSQERSPGGELFSTRAGRIPKGLDESVMSTPPPNPWRILMRISTKNFLRTVGVAGLALSFSLTLVACDAPSENAPETETAQLGLTTTIPAPVLECGTKTLIEDVCAGEGYWVSRAEEKCASRGWDLTQYSLLSKCKAKGKYGYSDIKFECCGETVVEPEVIEPEIVEPADVLECSTGSIDNDTCQSEAGWVAMAKAKCATRDWKLTNYSFASKCKENGKYGYGDIKFQCCGLAPEVIEPEVIEETASCFPSDIVSDLCVSEATLLAKAGAFCGENGADVTSAGVGFPCNAKGKKGFHAIKFECCKAELETADDVTDLEDGDIDEVDSCWQAALGGPDSCMDAEELEMAVHTLCKDSGQVVSQFGLSTPCKAGKKGTKGYRFAKFQCCDLETVEPVEPTEPTEPEEANACWAASMGGVSVCLPESSFEAKAQSACANQGQGLSEFAVGSPCKTKKGKGYRFAKFQCCDATDLAPMDLVPNKPATKPETKPATKPGKAPEQGDDADKNEFSKSQPKNS
jgi:hypothetical protein